MKRPDQHEFVKRVRWHAVCFFPDREMDVDPLKGLRSFAYQSLVLLFALSSALALQGFRALVQLQDEVKESLDRSEERLDRLRERALFDSARRRLAEGIREEILRARPRLGRDRSSELAALVVDASERHPSVDPLLLVAVGVVESGFDVRATSTAGARGLYQIQPATGRLLARKLGWEFEESLLHDPAKNTEMAACYLDLLGGAYNDVEMILAEYNGGPLNAGYFRANAEKLASETRAYVPRVLAVYDRLGRELGRPSRVPVTSTDLP